MNIEMDNYYFWLFLIFITFILLSLIVRLFKVIRVGGAAEGKERVFVQFMMLM